MIKGVGKEEGEYRGRGMNNMSYRLAPSCWSEHAALECTQRAAQITQLNYMVSLNGNVVTHRLWDVQGSPSCLNYGKRRLFFSSFHSSCHYLFPPLIIFFFLRLMHDYDTDVRMLSHWDSQMGSARRVHLPSSVSGQGRHLQSWHHVLRDSLSQYSI